MRPNAREPIARKQRTTLRHGVKLIDALRSAPSTYFNSNSEFAGTSSSNVPQNWLNAFKIGAFGDTQNKKIIGAMFRGMYINKLLLEDDKWRPVKPLGHGSYGAAALFKRENDDGQDDDYVVAKYTDVRATDMVPGWNSNISREAAIMMQTNELDNDGILYLREFRYIQDTNRHLYLTEYCPNFDCDVLRLTHKAMKQNLPEALIWYIFYALAKGLVAMEQGPFGNYATPHSHVPGAFIAHRDIKPPNTFLGYTPAPLQPLDESDPGYLGNHFRYPHAKIADFGISVITTLSDPDNTAGNHMVGSSLWYPPEVRLNALREGSRYYPFRGTLYDIQGNLLPVNERVYEKNWHTYTPAGNVFVVGLMMYQFITLDEPETMSRYLNRIMHEDELQPTGTVMSMNAHDMSALVLALQRLLATSQGGYGLTDSENRTYDLLYNRWKMFSRWQAIDYGNTGLKGLVENCMEFLPEKRVSARALLDQLEAMLPYYWQILGLTHAVEPDLYEQSTKAFTTEADLPQMRPGTADVKLDARFWRRLVKAYKWLDASSGTIRPQMDPNDSNIPAEARVLFSAGRKEDNNRQTERREVSNDFEQNALANDPRLHRLARGLKDDDF